MSASSMLSAHCYTAGSYTCRLGTPADAIHGLVRPPCVNTPAGFLDLALMSSSPGHPTPCRITALRRVFGGTVAEDVVLIFRINPIRLPSREQQQTQTGRSARASHGLLSLQIKCVLETSQTGAGHGR